MTELAAPFGIDISTTLVGSGVTLLLSGAVMQYGHRVDSLTSAELFQVVGVGFLALGLLVALVLAVATR